MTDLPEAYRPRLETADLEFHYGSRQVLRNIRLALLPGRHYVLAGPNGAGKSTLLDLLARLKTPSRGTVEIAGRPAAAYGPRALARLLALAPQEYRLDFSFTVREVVAMGRRPFQGRWGRPDERDQELVDGAIAALHLGELSGRPVTALSGGERRRCIVARALAQTTPIVLLDEPSAGLDIAQSLSLMALARSLAEQGALVVTVSHDLNLAACYGHEFIFLKNGLLAAFGPVAETFTDAILADIYETDARVRHDDFSGGLAVSFRSAAATSAYAMPVAFSPHCPLQP